MTSTRASTRQPAAARRRAREREILKATRELFDESGVRDAQIEDIARAVGVNRAIIYRHFSGKEELFALTLVSYLDDLETRLATASRSRRTPMKRLVAVTEEFIDFGVEYPAFVDCAQTLMRRPGPELLEEISESSLFRLGRGISACLTQLSDVLDAGVESGDFKVSDPTLLANHMYASGLGALQLARVGMLVKESAPGIPAISPVSAADVRSYVVSTAVALATAS
ncbi:MAG: TetR/AcrR family transcriptional regulator [Marmoricola sp.]|jgi:AcrR family transcriptional regulator|nr:TetR/AcrR family transcriptional regulator [Marmoricola sp.]MCW2820813.1 TetR/AcrR family transcriptional regulator [Marmoricola sp.]